MILLIIGLILFIAIALFSFPQFSPIPYFPSNPRDMSLILKSLNLKNNQILFDLGAGNGTVIFKAAHQAFEKKLNTRFVATEINPILLCILYIRKLFHPNRKNITIMYSNMFTANYQPLITNHYSLIFYLYISPWYLEKVISNIKSKISNFTVVSYMYKIKSLNRTEKRKEGKIHDVFIYNI